jgi:hypothetical protein
MPKIICEGSGTIRYTYKNPQKYKKISENKTWKGCHKSKEIEWENLKKNQEMKPGLLLASTFLI